MRPGHGDHWLAALDASDARLRAALAVPLDAPAGLKLHRSDLSDALDMVQVTRERRLVTAYPEPRATSLIQARPIELRVWETRAEGWLTVEHDTVGALTVFLTDLAENAPRYAAALTAATQERSPRSGPDGSPDERGDPSRAGTRRGLALEVGAIAYTLARATSRAGPARIEPASRTDPRFLPDDYAFHGDVVAVRSAAAGGGDVLDLAFQGELEVPVAWREASSIEPGGRAVGYLWLTGRLASRPDSKAL